MIRIRPARPDDADAIAAIYRPHVEQGTATFELEPPDAEEMRARLGKAGGLYPWFVATKANADAGVLAYAYAASFHERPAYRWTVQTTIYVAAGAQRQGAGRLLYQALIETLRAQGFNQAAALIALPNPGSIALHEAIGFRRAGVWREVGFKHGRWIDVGLWQCALNGSLAPPAEPRAFAEVGVVRG